MSDRPNIEREADWYHALTDDPHAWPEGATDRVLATLRAELKDNRMTEHVYSVETSPYDTHEPWYKRHQRATCACGWVAEGYVRNDFTRSQYAEHLRIADLADREAEVAAGRLCAFCEDKAPVHTLCRLDDHCDRNGCVRSCRHCMDELRDERYED